MRASLDWLRDYVDIQVAPDELAARLIAQGLQVEGIEAPGAGIQGVVVGLILELRPHPESSDWSIARVDVGGRETVLVTGARNVAAGDRVPVALPGAELPGGDVIREETLRGVASHGMLCSGAELGLSSDASGILILPSDTVPGTGIGEALGLKVDHVFDIDILQRADCLGYAFLAREFAAALQQPFREPEIRVREEGIDSSRMLRVSVEAPDLCPRYAARLVTDIRLAPSPWWMARRLMAAGVRPINNLVDITNYVMLEMNQPLHAFDYDRLEGGRIIVRRARPDETIVTLDGVERALDTGILVIADAARPVAAAGIMGGESSEITGSTQTVLLESAWFDMAANRRASAKLGLRTEASIRFGKGIDPLGVMRAMDRAAQLIEELGAGKVARGFVDIHGELPRPLVIDVRPERVNALLGSSIPLDETIACLKRLPFGVETGENAIRVTVPTFRTDIHEEIDLVEEIARIYGYNRIPSTVPKPETVGRLNPAQQAESRLRNVLSGQGLSEVIAWHLVDPVSFDRLELPADHPWRKAPGLLMPMSVEQSVVRPALMIGLMDIASYNARRQQSDLRLFEIGHVVGELPPSGKELPCEQPQLGILLMGRDKAADWLHTGREADFFELKGIVETVLDELTGAEAVFEPQELPAMHPGRTASIRLGHHVIGFAGEVHPAVLENYGLSRRVCYAQIDLPRLLAGAPVPQSQPLPRFPGVERDIALLVPDSVPATRVLRCIEQAGTELLERVRLFDVYRGGQVAEGWRSLAFSLLLRHNERTLTEADVNAAMEAILDAAATEVGARRR